MATRKTTAKKKPTRKATAKKPTENKNLIQVSEGDGKTLEGVRLRTEAKVTQLGRLRMQIMALEEQERQLRDEVVKASQTQTAMIETVAMKYKINLEKETWEFVFGDNIFRRRD